MADRSKDAVNAANAKMRAQPWYAQWFQSKGLNPNMVHLSDAQRKELAGVAAQNGMPLGSGEMVDPAGNFHTQTGFAGWPTWAKIAAIAAPVAAGTLFTGGADLGFLGMGGAPTVASGAGAALPAATVAGAGAGAGATAATAGGLTLGGILKYGVPSAVNAGLNIYGSKTQANSANTAAQLQADAATRAAELQAQAAKDALAFQQQSEATRKAEWDKTQAQNLDFYNQAQARLTPYRNMGLGALMQMRRPIGA